MTVHERLTHAIIPGERAVWCVNCEQVSDSTGDECIACGGIGGLMSLARVLGGGKCGEAKDVGQEIVAANGS